jgi:uncharacterized protein
MKFNNLFKEKPLIACIHLMSLPGSPQYKGSMDDIVDTALKEAEIFSKYGCHGLLIENFRDYPFVPDNLAKETVASLAVVTREIVRNFNLPVGVNALRNDAYAAMAVATAAKAQFIRVNIHIGAAISDQGIIQGKAHETLRLRANLKSDVLIFADVAVKHAVPVASRSLDLEVKDIEERGLADAIIVTGDRTGGEADITNLNIVKQNTSLPVLIGSGLTAENMDKFYAGIDGMIVGSYFKKDGKADHFVEEEKVRLFILKLKQLKV